MNPKVQSTHIQKHHRQLTRSVRTPPSGGPKHTAIPKTLNTIPRNNGRLSSSTVSPTMLNAPWYKPAAPIPDIARPIINTAEVGPEAHMIDPTLHVGLAYGPQCDVMGLRLLTI